MFAILSHCLNTTATNNYSASANGKWSCEDTDLKGSAPSVPLDDFGKYPHGSKPRIASGASPETSDNSLFALILATLRFKEMSWGTAQGNDGLAATEFLESELVKKGFRTVDLLSGFVASEGKSLPIDLSMGDFDLKTNLSECGNKSSREN